MKKNIGILLMVACFSILIGLLVYKLYPVTTITQYGFSVDVGKLLRDYNEKRRETLLIGLGGIEYTRELDDLDPKFFYAWPPPVWSGEWYFRDEAPVVKYKDGSHDICWINYKTGEVELFPEAPPAERMREFIPQDASSQELYAKYIKEGKTPMAAAGNVFADNIELLLE